MTKNWRWFISKTLRDAVELHKQVIKLLAAQSDRLKPSRVEELQNALDALKAKLTGPVDKTKLLDEMDAMMIVADRVLLPYPDPKARDWVEMFLVVAVLVLAFRTFFFQPFKIPTGSMQPTLYGINVDNLMDRAGKGSATNGTLTAKLSTFRHTDVGHQITFANGNLATITAFYDDRNVKVTPAINEQEQDFTISFDLPGRGEMVTEKFRGYSYHSLKAEGNWELTEIKPPKTFFPLISKQTLLFTDSDTHKVIKKTIWFPSLDPYQNPILRVPIDPETDKLTLDEYGIPSINDTFSKGDFVFKLRVKTGDHLFVNRITFNFRRPRRGDICVFTTKGVSGINPPEKFYIKRLVALGGESVLIGEDHHIRINGRRLDANDPGFEFLYDFPIKIEKLTDSDTGKPILVINKLYQTANSAYSGHLSQGVLPRVTPDHYMMCGDNTISSDDSRRWGYLAMRNVIGKSSFVYWPPLSPRFGWSHR